MYQVKASNTVHATSQEMKTDELTIIETKNTIIYRIEVRYTLYHMNALIDDRLLFLINLYDLHYNCSRCIQFCEGLAGD